MINPKMVLAMAEYLKASEDLADATDDLINAHRREDHMGPYVEYAKVRLEAYRQARLNWENLQ